MCSHTENYTELNIVTLAAITIPEKSLHGHVYALLIVTQCMLTIRTSRSQACRQSHWALQSFNAVFFHSRGIKHILSSSPIAHLLPLLSSVTHHNMTQPGTRFFLLFYFLFFSFLSTSFTLLAFCNVSSASYTLSLMVAFTEYLDSRTWI
jgi:hypothetical protein